jgi:hypothetical protein
MLRSFVLAQVPNPLRGTRAKINVRGILASSQALDFWSVKKHMLLLSIRALQYICWNNWLASQGMYVYLDWFEQIPREQVETRLTFVLALAPHKSSRESVFWNVTFQAFWQVLESQWS